MNSHGPTPRGVAGLVVRRCGATLLAAAVLCSCAASGDRVTVDTSRSSSEPTADDASPATVSAPTVVSASSTTTAPPVTAPPTTLPPAVGAATTAPPTTTPPTAAPPTTAAPSPLAGLSGLAIGGQACRASVADLDRCPASQPGSWRFFLTVTALRADGWSATGQIEWTTLGSVHQVELTTDGTTLHFVETEAIVSGTAQLGCVYDIAVAGGSGAWSCPDGSAGPFHFDADLP